MGKKSLTARFVQFGFSAVGPGFVERAFKDSEGQILTDHLQKKYDGLAKQFHEKGISGAGTPAFFYWFQYLDAENQKIFLDWLDKNYNG